MLESQSGFPVARLSAAGDTRVIGDPSGDAGRAGAAGVAAARHVPHWRNHANTHWPRDAASACSMEFAPAAMMFQWSDLLVTAVPM